MKLKKTLLVVALAFAVLGLDTLTACTGWSDTYSGGGSDISCPEIIKKWDATWFHYDTETCPLKVKRADAYDYDWYNDGDGFDQVETDCLDDTGAIWSGVGITGATGFTATWDPPAPTTQSGTPITFIVDDFANTPSPAYSGRDVYDGPVTRNIPMYAYEAVAYLNCTSSNSGSPTTGPLYETTSGTDCINLSLDVAEITADDNGENPSDTAFGTATWILSTRPSEASLDSTGQLRADINAHTSGGGLLARVYDEDDDSGEATTISVGLSGGTGFAASVSVDITIASDDDCEGDVGSGFAFSSDHLGDDTSDDLKAESGELCGDMGPYHFYEDVEEPFSYGQSVVFRGTKGSESKAKGVVSVEVSCKDTSIFWDSWAKGSAEGTLTYVVWDPTYEPGEFQQNSNW